MPSKTANAATARREEKYYPAMMRIAAEMGCHLRPVRQNPAKMRGFCPFHAAITRNAARTLDVDTAALRFACSYCNASGPPSAFAAMAWNVSARDARELLDSHSDTAGAHRPPYLRENERRRSPNTAVLTRAADHYRQQLTAGSPLSLPALMLAAQLGLELDDAAAAGMGMCTGEGLAQYLRSTGVSDQELRESPLFIQGNLRREFLAGRVVLTDPDYTGAALWLNSINPRNSAAETLTGPNRPRMLGLNGPHPYLMGMDRARSEGREVIVTDDVRLHLIARAAQRASLLWTSRPQDESTEGKREAARRVAERLSTVPAKTVALMMHDSGTRAMCAEVIGQDGRNRKVLSFGKERIVSELNPATRDLPALFPPSGRRRRTPDPAAGGQQPDSQKDPEPGTKAGSTASPDTKPEGADEPDAGTEERAGSTVATAADDPKAGPETGRALNPEPGPDFRPEISPEPAANGATETTDTTQADENLPAIRHRQ